MSLVHLSGSLSIIFASTALLEAIAPKDKVGALHVFIADRAVVFDRCVAAENAPPELDGVREFVICPFADSVVERLASRADEDE